MEEEEESVAKSSHKSDEEDDEEYENEEFDDLDEDIASDDKQGRILYPSFHHNSYFILLTIIFWCLGIKNKAGRSDSGGSDNASYSRMVYGNEEDEEDVSSESLEESKPKILSFAGMPIRRFLFLIDLFIFLFSVPFFQIWKICLDGMINQQLHQSLLKLRKKNLFPK